MVQHTLWITSTRILISRGAKSASRAFIVAPNTTAWSHSCNSAIIWSKDWTRWRWREIARETKRYNEGSICYSTNKMRSGTKLLSWRIRSRRCGSILNRWWWIRTNITYNTLRRSQSCRETLIFLRIWWTIKSMRGSSNEMLIQGCTKDR